MDLQKNSDGDYTSHEISILMGLFTHKTTSYKYLFFYALMQECWRLKEDSFSIRASELMLRGLVVAWYPHTLFRLSFGKRDQAAQVLDGIAYKYDVKTLKFTPKDEDLLFETLQTVAQSRDIEKLIRWVPYRLLTPFFASELRGLPDGQKNSAIVQLSNVQTTKYHPFYRVEPRHQKDPVLHVHPHWVEYFRNHRGILENWFRWGWLQYLQKHNPNTPGLSGKLFPVLQRSALKWQREYWRNALDLMEVRCIYTQKSLTFQVSLDHYVPWSFVLHDRIWNLIPVDAGANSSKSDCLPANLYLDGLAHTQAEALYRLHTTRLGNRVVEEFIQDLSLPHEDLRWALAASSSETLRDLLSSTYLNTIPTLVSLAGQQGFQTQWRMPS